MSLIQINNINKIYGTGVNAASILNNLSLNIEQGEFVSITGASGSGKSTLLNIMGLLDTADNGSYMLNGVPVEGMNDSELTKYRLLNTGFIFQSFNLVQTSTVEDNITLPLVYNGVSSKPQRQAQCNQILEAMGISGTGDRLPSELSGGQQQRVAIARALINNPKVVFADEPTGNLDTHSGEAVMQIIHQLHAAGTTVVMVTHDPGIAKQAQRSIVVRDGSVVVDPSLVPAYQIYAPMPQSLPVNFQPSQSLQPQQPIMQQPSVPQPQFFPAVQQSQPSQSLQPQQPIMQQSIQAPQQQMQPVYSAQPNLIAQPAAGRPQLPQQYAPDPRFAQLPVADVRQQQYAAVASQSPVQLQQTAQQSTPLDSMSGMVQPPQQEVSRPVDVEQITVREPQQSYSPLQNLDSIQSLNTNADAGQIIAVEEPSNGSNVLSTDNSTVVDNIPEEHRSSQAEVEVSLQQDPSSVFDIQQEAGGL
jgi:putative ABC transport system ATP-binding protein